MTQLITLLFIPMLIEIATQWLKKDTSQRQWVLDHPQAILALLTIVGGTAFVTWQFFIPNGWKELALVAYPIFAAGAIFTHKFVRPIFEAIIKNLK